MFRSANNSNKPNQAKPFVRQSFLAILKVIKLTDLASDPSGSGGKYVSHILEALLPQGELKE